MECNTSNSSYNAKDDIDTFPMLPWMPRCRFYLLLALELPSFCCTIAFLYYFKWNQLKNQIYGFLIIINVLIVIAELPITLYFLYEETLRSDHICTSWITFNYSLFLMSIVMMVWTSIERYLFIYHEQMIMQHAILLHYVPIICIILYCPLVYVCLIVLYPCKSIYNIRLYLCGGACYESELILGMMDRLGNNVCMVIIIFIVNIILIVRHLIQRHRLKGAIITAWRRRQWRRSIKLSMRLLSVGILYMIAWIPYSMIVIVQIFNDTKPLEFLLSTFFVYMPYLQALLLPYICILFIPQIKEKISSLFLLLSCKKVLPRKNRIQFINNEQNRLYLNYH